MAARPGSLTPIAQDPLGEGALDEQLASLMFGPEVLGVVLAHEVLVLPPSADTVETPEEAAEHPDKREVRMVVGVMRDGSRECVLRLRTALRRAKTTCSPAPTSPRRSPKPCSPPSTSSRPDARRPPYPHLPTPRPRDPRGIPRGFTPGGAHARSAWINGAPGCPPAAAAPPARPAPPRAGAPRASASRRWKSAGSDRYDDGVTCTSVSPTRAARSCRCRVALIWPRRPVPLAAVDLVADAGPHQVAVQPPHEELPDPRVPVQHERLPAADQPVSDLGLGR